MSEVYVDEEIINFLFEQLKISLKEKIKDNSSNYKYIISYSEIKKILTDKYDIDLDLKECMNMKLIK